MQALLADRNPTEVELQKEEIEHLKTVNESLNDRILSFEVIRYYVVIIITTVSLEKGK